ncbi:MAG: hypothetical protein FGM41_09940 [Bacteroidetes bacterium]|jgi:hypothetical protein|nr:hypothetical protein [Bacteroidota bacterium]
MKKYILSVILLFALTFLSTSIMAQPGFDDDTDDVPVDGGISLLMAAGIGYGIKRIKDKRSK